MYGWRAGRLPARVRPACPDEFVGALKWLAWSLLGGLLPVLFLTLAVVPVEQRPGDTVRDRLREFLYEQLRAGTLPVLGFALLASLLIDIFLFEPSERRPSRFTLGFMVVLAIMTFVLLAVGRVAMGKLDMLAFGGMQMFLVSAFVTFTFWIKKDMLRK